MPLTVSVINVVLSLSAFIYSFAWWGRRRIRMLLPMTLILFGQSLFELFLRVSGDEWEALTAFRFSIAVSTPTCVFLYLFSREYCEIPVRSHLKKAAMFVIPACYSVSVLLFPRVLFAYRAVDFAFDRHGVLISTTNAPLSRLNYIYSLLLLLTAFYTFSKHSLKKRSGGTFYLLNALFIVVTGTTILKMVNIARTARDDINFLLFTETVSALVLAVLTANGSDSTLRVTGRDYVLQKLSEPYILVNSKGGFLDANDAAMRVFPVLSRLRIGTNLKKVAEIPAQISASDGELNIRVLTEGDTRYYHVSHTLLQTDKVILGTGIMMFDITGQQELVTAAKRMAQRDSLTGMYNRNAFLRTASQDFAMVRRGKYDASVILCEVDNFSSINENFGYAAGDDVVASVAKTLVTRLRKTDIVARYDNEQFAVWLPATPFENAVNVARSLQKIVSETRISTQHVSLTVELVFGAAYAKIPDSSDKAIEIDTFESLDDTNEEELVCLLNLLKEADTKLTVAKAINRSK